MTGIGITFTVANGNKQLSIPSFLMGENDVVSHSQLSAKSLCLNFRYNCSSSLNYTCTLNF